jgi:branched-chain amino acid transport system ATP-binding protein
VLKISNICAGYGLAPVLNGLSMELEGGEVKTLLGPNNAGKSTMLKVICGLLRPTKGEITLDETNIIHLLPDEINAKGLVLVPERRRLFPDMTVIENLLLGNYCKKARPNRRNLLEMVHNLFPRLKERPKQLAGTLSGGEQQMLAIARGLMAQPRFLLLDEPSLGLAPIIIKVIFNNLRNLTNEGIAILLAEQNSTQALKVSKYAYVLANGCVALEGVSNTMDPKRVEELFLRR